MSPNKIKALLVGRGIKQTDIAKALQVKRSSVCSVINGYHASKRVQQYIATLLDKDPVKLWG